MLQKKIIFISSCYEKRLSSTFNLYTQKKFQTQPDLNFKIYVLINITIILKKITNT